MNYRTTLYGFEWFGMRVTRLASFPHGRRGTSAVIVVNDLEIYVSPTGRSTRVFRKGKELK